MFKILSMKGSYYYYNDANVAQGKDQLKTFFVDNPEVATEIETKLLTAIEEAEK